MAVPYAEMLGGRDAQQVIGETTGRLAKALEGKTSEQLEERSASGKWNRREVMAHIADCEIAWAWRLRIAYDKDRAEMQPFEQDAWSKMYGQYTFAAAVATFNALRAWNVAFVAGLSEADRSKPIVHPERGEEKLWTIVEIMAGHDLHHLAKLERGE